MARRRPRSRGGQDPAQPGQHARRRRRPAAAPPDLQHAEQRAHAREGVRTAAARRRLAGHLHTCDVDLATPVVQEATGRGKLALAACIGTDQMGPSASARCAGASPSASGTSPRTRARRWPSSRGAAGWRRAALATDTVIVYFKNVVQSFKARWRQLGGRIVTEESYQSAPGGGSPNIPERDHAPEPHERAGDRDLDRGVFGGLSGLISGLRTLRTNTPILNSWAGDGNYWLPTNPRVTKLLRHVRIRVGRRPNPAVRRLVNSMRAAGAAPGTGGFLTGPAMIDGLVTAYRGRRARRRRRARRAAGEVPRCAHALREDQLLEEPPQRVRPHIPRHAHPEQPGELRGGGQGEGRGANRLAVAGGR